MDDQGELFRYVWPVFHFYCNGWEKGEGTAEGERFKVVFHFCSGGARPPQTITMLLHYHGNSSIGAQDGKGSSFVPLGSLAAFCCLCSSSAGDRRFLGSGTFSLPLVDFIASEQRNLLTLNSKKSRSDLSHHLVQITVLCITCLPYF